VLVLDSHWTARAEFETRQPDANKRLPTSHLRAHPTRGPRPMAPRTSTPTSRLLLGEGEKTNEPTNDIRGNPPGCPAAGPCWSIALPASVGDLGRPGSGWHHGRVRPWVHPLPGHRPTNVHPQLRRSPCPSASRPTRPTPWATWLTGRPIPADRTPVRRLVLPRRPSPLGLVGQSPSTHLLTTLGYVRAPRSRFVVFVGLSPRSWSWAAGATLHHLLGDDTNQPAQPDPRTPARGTGRVDPATQPRATLAPPAPRLRPVRPGRALPAVTPPVRPGSAWPRVRKAKRADPRAPTLEGYLAQGPGLRWPRSGCGADARRGVAKVTGLRWPAPPSRLAAALTGSGKRSPHSCPGTSTSSQSGQEAGVNTPHPPPTTSQSRPTPPRGDTTGEHPNPKSQPPTPGRPGPP